MTRFPTNAAATLVSGLMIAVGSLAPATARVYTARAFLDCGSGWDFCMQACDYTVPGGEILGKCYDYCAKGTSVCEASRIPSLTRHRSLSRYTIGRK
jgi:hypothetical protein